MGLFKPYLISKPGNYKGGKSRMEMPEADRMIKLSSNENLLGASPKAVAAIKYALSRINEYPDRTDIRLREALSHHYENKVTPAQFVTDNSGTGLLQLIAWAFLGEGLECIFCNPAFKPYSLFSKRTGATVHDVPLTGPDFKLDIPGIREKINSKTRVIWICSPNNPSGTIIPKQDLDNLIEGLPDHLVVVYDEVYHHFVQNEDYTTGLPYIAEGKKIIAINSFSKAYGLAGMRLGFAYTTEEIASYLRMAQRPFLMNTLSLEAAIGALGDSAFIAKTVKVVNSGKETIYKTLDRMKVKYWKSHSNFFLIASPIDEKEFENYMISKRVMVRPMSGFGAPGCIRVTIGTEEANMVFLSALEDLMKRIKK